MFVYFSPLIPIWFRTYKLMSYLSDNDVLVHIINSQTTKEPYMMALVRALVLKSLAHNINFFSTNIPGLQNTNAALLSHVQVAEFYRKSLHMVYC